MSHRAHLDVPTPTLRTVTAWIATARRGSGCRPWQRATTVHQQVLLVLRWMRHLAALADLAQDAHVSIATAYRYLHEGLDVIAGHAPHLHDVLTGARDRGLAYLCLDGTLIPIDRVAARTERGNNTWYSGKNHQFSANIQVISDPNGHPLWVSPVRPGSMHDLRCARELVLPTLYPFCRLRPDGHSLLPVLADKGYIGAGIGVRVPHRRPTGGQVLDHVTLDPWAITKIAAAALVLTRLQLPVR